jgi:hypothetical protein
MIPVLEPALHREPAEQAVFLKSEDNGISRKERLQAERFEGAVHIVRRPA